jgi:hypothetical protein
MTFRIITLNNIQHNDTNATTLSIHDTWHNNTANVLTLFIGRYVGCRYAECHYAQGHGAVIYICSTKLGSGKNLQPSLKLKVS